MPDLPSCDLKAVKHLFDTCEPLDQTGREEALADPSHAQHLVEEVRRLLAIADGDQQYGEQENIIGLQLRDLSQSLERGQRLGAYRVEREIGRGGMGIVFLAHRDDGSYRQQVAIKIAPSFASGEELKNFHRERQILAELQHPNIAMLLDGGATPEQRPYLVMEHIEGAAITDYCETQQLDLQARLRLFLAVCDAVSFAHSRLVIHRDIKPENVLVTAEGQVKLLDFGVSKILHSDQKNSHTTLLMGLTPAYASPEQVKGEATTTATDIYGLGALLYRLLSGTSPHPAGNASTEQTIRAICETEPAQVSKAAAREDSAITSQSLRGDIDNIVATTLRKEPQNRYASVSELQKDIERFLRGEPVMATPPGFLYRSGKFVRRYPAASLLALSVFVAISGGLAASTHLASKLRIERDNLLAAQAETQRQAHTAQRVTQMLIEMFDAASPARAQGRTVDVEQLLTSAASKTRASLNEEPAVKAQLLKTLAQVNFNTGKYRDAVELQREALALIPEAAVTAGTNRIKESAHTKAESLVQLGRYLRELGEMDEAADVLSQALELLSRYPDQRLKAHALYRKGQLISKSGSPDEAIGVLNAAQELWDKLPDKGAEAGIGTRHTLSNAYFNKADFATSARIEETVLADQIVLLGDTHPDTLNSYRHLARSYMRTGRWREARDKLEHAYRIGKKIFSHDNGIYRETASAYARLVRRLGDHQLAIEVLSELLAGEAQSPESTAQLLNHRGYTYLEMGLFTESRNDLEKANAILEEIYPDGSDATLLSRANLGEAMTVTGDFEAGVALINKVKEQNIAQFGADDYGVAAWNLKLARIALRANDPGKAQELAELSRAIFLKTFSRNQPLVLEVDEVEIQISLARADRARAIGQCKALIRRFDEVFPGDAPIIAKYRNLLAELQASATTSTGRVTT